MSESRWMPSTEWVRESYASTYGGYEHRSEARADFNEWLSAHLAEAWDEGFKARNPTPYIGTRMKNPYRAEAQHEE